MTDETLAAYETSKEPQWTLSVVNGRVRLESKFTDFQELMMYHQASIRYLSPLAGLLQRENVRFEGMSASVAFASTGMVERCTPHKGRQITIKQLPHPIDYRREMDQLIHLYMQRFKVITGVVHEPTFMDHYRRLSDPLNSAIALGVCIDAIAYFYPQLKYSPLVKQQLAEFFYGRCRDLLIDCFEDSERQLEAVVTTNLVMQYLQDVLMEYHEARRLVTVALLACAKT
ncbi:hypothetical protein BDB00DRAFT_789688 [Zychaea mexicana]|uniref:uncharacterized protein n=1 Tax=Zychaea mexicana TaxID=64656 RepID=UPI0022FE157C|nr:uncharacterized protein BDB00DRAFT_789688 [Zychaea mexicana]KAI9491301.1 hypothetical protein BDB00DRAFT_789688 [Zychaea mexicana]